MAKAAGTTRTPPDLDSDLTLEDLIAFGRDYLKEIEANEATEASARIPIDLPLNVLKQYLARSIDGLVLLQAEQARKTPKKANIKRGRQRTL
jgi:hypothetical protein